MVRAIALGRARIGEISNAAGIPTPNLTKMLRRLEALGYVEARAPLSPNGPEAKRSSYRLVDPFFRFWLLVVAQRPHRGGRGRRRARAL